MKFLKFLFGKSSKAPGAAELIELIQSFSDRLEEKCEPTSNSGKVEMIFLVSTFIERFLANQNLLVESQKMTSQRLSLLYESILPLEVHLSKQDFTNLFLARKEIYTKEIERLDDTSRSIEERSPVFSFVSIYIEPFSSEPRFVNIRTKNMAPQLNDYQKSLRDFLWETRRILNDRFLK